MPERTLYVDFVNNPSLTGHEGPDWTCERDSWATFTDADGLIRTVYDNEIRCDAATWRASIAEDSEDLTSWNGPVDATIGTGITDSDGGSAAFNLKATAQAGIQTPYIRNNFPVKAGGKYLLSVKAKRAATAATDVQAFLGWSFATTTGGVILDFDLGTLTDSAVAFTSTGVSDLGGGWYQFWGVVEPGAGDADLDGYFYLGLSSDAWSAFNRVEDPDGTEEVYFYQPMMEDLTGKATPSAPGSYIATGSNYEPVSEISGTSNGLINEPTSTNLIRYSEDISNVWSAGVGAVLTTNQATAPDGSTTADMVNTDNAGGSTSAAYASQLVSGLTASASYIFSAFIKADQLDWATIYIGNMASQSLRQYYDLTNVAVGTPQADVTDSGITSYGNGWYRCWLRFTCDATDTSANFRVGAADADTDHTVDRDETSSIFIWGAQLEATFAGQDGPSTYIPTTSATVTRDDDWLNTTDVSWYTQAEGSGYVHYVPTYYDDNLSNSTGFEVIEDSIRFVRLSSLYTSGSRTGQARWYTRDSTQVVLAGGNSDIASGDNVRTGLYYTSLGPGAMYLGGDEKGTSSTVYPPSDPVSARIGGSSGFAAQNALVKEVAWWDTSLDAAAMTALTTDGTMPSFGMVVGDEDWWRRRRIQKRNRRRNGWWSGF